MAAHDEILRAAVRICRERGNWRFRPVEVVRALPHLDEGTVRTHVVSRCCTNAPAHHPHRWDYFRRVARGVYEVRRPYRRTGTSRKRAKGSTRSVAEPPAAYAREAGVAERGTIHAVVTRGRGWYVGECLEVAVVTQGRTLDELVTNLREAVELHLDGEDPAALGLVPAPRLSVTYELPSRAGR